MGDNASVRDIHEQFTVFKQEYPAIYKAYEALGRTIHEDSGPLPEKYRWLIKVAVSGASGHGRALETHIAKARAAGAADAEILHALLLLVQTSGFPAFMEAYAVFKQQG
jgi:AhpD family alkylhydroperoxidase